MMLQEEIVAALRSRVDAWRGFALGSASEAYPEEAPKYQPSAQGERPVSEECCYRAAIATLHQTSS